ncbi:hypothetical protein H4R19_001228, partial [Coemansia spiralis]
TNRLKIKLGSRRKGPAKSAPKAAGVRPAARSNASSDSEDMPMALSMSSGAVFGADDPFAADVIPGEYPGGRPSLLDRDSLVDVVGDGHYSPSYGLPAIAGTRPPPIAGPDVRFNSPAYAAPPVGGDADGAAAAPKVKLKLKMGKASKAAPPSRARSPSFSSQSPHYSTVPRISSPLATSPAYKAPEETASGGWSPVYNPPEVGVSGSPSLRRGSSTLQSIVASGGSGGGAGLSGATRKALHRILRKISKHQAAFPFLRPVDVVLDGCPTYYDIIKHPMDLGTIKMKLESPGGYLAPSAFEADVRQMFANCYAFNPPGTPVHDMGRAVEAAFDAEWAKAALSDAAAQAAGPAKRKSAPKPLPDAGSAVAAPETPKRQKTSDGAGADPEAGDSGAAPTTPAAKGTKTARPASATKARSKKADVAGLSGRAKAARKRSAGQAGSLAAADAAGLGALDDPDAIMEYLDRSGTAGTAGDTAGTAGTAGGDWRTMCRRVLLRLQGQKSALEFMAPVDVIRQGVPTYFDVVKQPMDLGTIRKNLDRGLYQSADEFRDHVQLVLANCFLFNPAGTYVHDQGLALQHVFEAAWRHQAGAEVAQTPLPAASIPADVPLAAPAALERARAIVARLKRDDCAWPFLQPVDPVALGVPTYFDIVKNPMDLSTIQKKLGKKAYPAVADFVADIQLIVDDCFLFNAPDTPVHSCGVALHALAATLLADDGWSRWLAPE